MAGKHSSFCHAHAWVKKAEMLHDQMRFLAFKIESSILEEEVLLGNSLIISSMLVTFLW